MAIDMDVARIMTREVITVGPEVPVAQIAALLWRHKISAVPVVEGGEVLGMVTETDLIERESEYDAPIYVPFLDAYFRIPGTGHTDRLQKILATTARELMSAPAIVVAPTATIQQLATLLVEKHLTTVPVLEDRDRLVGIVSRSDVVRLMSQEEQEVAAESEE